MRKGVIITIFIFIVIVALTIKKLNLYPSITSFVNKQGAASVGLQKIKDVPLTGEANRLDYQSIDLITNRLFISHLGSNMVHVFDLKTQKIVADIPLSANPYGILAVPSLKKVYVGVGGNNKIAVIDEKTLGVTKYIEAGKTPDGLAYDPDTNKLFVSNENGGTVSDIDTQSDKHTSDITVGSGVGNTHYFESGKKIYTAVGDQAQLVEIDPSTERVIQKYQLAGCLHPHGFLIDDQTHQAFITCDENNVMLVFDLDTKKVIAADTVGAAPDVLAYDKGLHRLYVAGESGVMSIFSVEKSNVKKVSEGFIAPNAHTVAVDQTTHYVYLPLENSNGKPVLRILKPASSLN